MPFISFSLPTAVATMLCQVRVLRILMTSFFFFFLTAADSVFYSLTDFCLCLCVCVAVPVCMWRSEINLGCHPLLLRQGLSLA